MTFIDAARGLVALMVLVSACSSPKSTVVLPEMRLRVTDEADRPIGGVPVLYGAETEIYRPPVLGVLPHIDGYLGARFAIKQASVTRENGEVVIPRRVLKQDEREHFRYEIIYVNVAVDPADSSARTSRQIMEEACRGRDPLCPTDERVEAIDVVDRMWLSPEDRAHALRQADKRFAVVRVLVVERERQKGLEYREADPIFVSRVVSSMRSSPEVIHIAMPGR